MTNEQKWLVDQWAEENARTLQSMTDARPTATCEAVQPDDAELTSALTSGLVMEVTFTLGSDTLMWVALPAATVTAVGNRTLVAAGIDDANEDDLRNTCQEFLQQSYGGLAQAISRRLQQGVSSKGKETDQLPTGPALYKLELGFSDSPVISTFFMFSQGLLDAFGLTRSEPLPKAPEAEVECVVSAPLTDLSQSKTFEILLEVSMPVSVSFGRTDILIKEALKLTTGSIVELNRNVSEPVDVLVNDRIIARGEVVVVNGNYGVRIKQIVSMQERFSTSTQNGTAHSTGISEGVAIKG